MRCIINLSSNGHRQRADVNPAELLNSYGVPDQKDLDSGHVSHVGLGNVIPVRVKCQASSARGASQQTRGFAAWPASSISAAKISRRVCSWSPWAFCGARWHGDREYPSEGHHARAEAFISVPCQLSPDSDAKENNAKRYTGRSQEGR